MKRCASVKAEIQVLACEAALNESPVSIQEAFPSPGTKLNKPKNARPEVKQRMTSLRHHSAR
jgi:hypothetical protein